MLMPGYDPVKAAQAAAFFALRAGGRINVLKLTKLLYLAEREFIREHDEPMFFDHLVSMPDGPVASITLNLINGNHTHEGWSRYIKPRMLYDIQVKPGVDLEALDELSRAEIKVLNSLWEKFKGYSHYEIRDWTHKKQNVPEWEDPRGSSFPIKHDKMFAGMGKSNPDQLRQVIEEKRALRQCISGND